MKSRPVFSINNLAIEIGRDRRTISAALRGVPPDGVTATGHDGWTMRTTLAALDLRGTGTGEQERARLNHARANLAELEYRQKAAQLLPAGAVDQAWAAITAAIRERCQAIPALAAARINPSRPIAEIETHIREEIDAAMSAISGAEIIATDELNSIQS